MIRAKRFRPGDLVYITVPGGGQHVFEFWPTPDSYQPSLDADPYSQEYAGDGYTPQFVCMDGSDSTLTVPGAGASSLTYEADTRELVRGASLFDPTTYKLTTSDGTVYAIDGASGAITKSTDANGNVTNYPTEGEDEITSGGVTVRINRTGSLITSIQLFDAGGTAIGEPIQYTYDSNDELILVQARDGSTTQYAYTSPSSPNVPRYLKTVTDARGVPVLNAVYDSLGELTSLTNAQGQTVPVSTGADDGSGDSQTVTDLTAQANTTQDIYDSEGNVVREIKSIMDSSGVVTYQVTVTQYTYFTGDLSAEISNIFPAEGATTPGFSNQNTVMSETDYQPFTVTDLADALSQAPATITREVDFGAAGDPSQGLPVTETDYLAGGATRVTTYGDYAFGKPQVTTVEIYAAGDTSTAAQTSTTYSLYDPHTGNLLFSFDALGQGTEYVYDDQGQLTQTWQVANLSTITGFSVTDPSTWNPEKLTTTPQSQNAYYSTTDPTTGACAGQVKYSVDAAGNTTWFAYDSLGDQVLAYKLWINPGDASDARWVGTTTTYDADGRSTSTTDNTYVAVASDGSYALPITLDENGNPIVNATLYSPNDVADTLLTGTTSYDPSGNAYQTTDQYGRTTTNLYDVNNNVVQTTNANGTVVRSVYDSMNRVIWQTDPYVLADGTASVMATHTIYDSLGRVVETDRYQGTDIQVLTDGYGLPSSTLGLNGTATGTLISTSSTVYNAQGQVAETTNAAGLRTGTIYYSDGEVEYTGPLNTVANTTTGATVAPVGGPYQLSYFASYTTYLYNQVDGGGQLFNRVIDADGHQTDTYTDVLGRTIETKYDDGSFTQTLYSVSGQAIPDYDLTPTIPAGGSEKIEIAQRKPGDPEEATIYVYDASGNLTDVWQPAVANPADGGSMTRPHTHYTYDSNGDELTQTDANGNTTSFTYDPNGNELSRTLPPATTGAATNTETFTYNIQGQEATHTDFDGNTATYTYVPAHNPITGLLDPNAGSLQEVDYIGSGKTPETVTYTYNDLGQQASVSDSAEATADDLTGMTTESYDPEGNLVGQDTPEGDIQHTYDPATGELIETKTVNTEVVYGYNSLGELTSTTVDQLNGNGLSTPLVTTDTYDPAGNKIQEDNQADGEVTTWSYDDLNRLTGMNEVQGDTTDFSQSFTLNHNGTRASSDQDQLQPDGSTTSTNTVWSYNALGMLTGETFTNYSDPTQDYTDLFTYDLVGNRLISDHTGPGAGANETITNTYNGDDQLTKEVSSLSGETDLAYDANGSLLTSTIGGSVTTYGYDVRNKMTSVTADSATTTYVYDDNGNRVAETTGGVTTYFLTDDANPTGYAQPIEQTSAPDGLPTVTYIIGDRVLGQADASGNVSYLLIDGHGSTRALTGSTGTITAAFNYTAFGTPIRFTPATWGTLGYTTSSSTGTVFLFGGDAVYDPASGFYLHGDGTRPTDGFVFTQMDDLRESTSDPLALHKYLYANGDPVNGWDPSGHEESATEESGVTGIQSLLIRSVVVGVNVFSKIRPVITLAVAIATISSPQAAESFLASGGNPSDLAGAILADVNALEAELATLGEPLAGSLAEESRLFQLMSPQSVATYLPESETQELASLAQFRSELGLPAAPGEDTLAKLVVGDRAFYGINASGQIPTVSVNAISATHAEVDALSQAKLAGASADNATLYVDRAPCYACWDSSAIRSAAAQAGIRVLQIVYPGGRVTFVTGTRG